MRRLAALLVVAIVAVVIWSGSGELPAPIRLWTTALVAFLPPLLILQAGALGELQHLSRSAIYASSAISLWLLAALTIAVVALARTPFAFIGFVWPGVAATLLWTTLVLSLGLALLVAANAVGLRESDFLRRILPTNADERRAFVGLSVTAGICEELVFRGFLVFALLAASGSAPVAVLLSSSVFGVLHAYQRPAGAVRAGALGALLALPLITTGSVLPGMLAHAGIDIIAGLWLRGALLR
jgi:membrane protease YdiL (CAAX protease family)